MPNSNLTVEPLTAGAFAPFGTVLELDPADLLGRFDHMAELADRRGGTRPNVALIHAAADALPAAIVQLERHPFSSQLFVPMGMSGRFLVVVAPDRDGAPDPRGLRAFVCEGARGIVYAPAVWHHALLSLVPCRFLMLVYENGGADDTHWAELPTPVSLRG